MAKANSTGELRLGLTRSCAQLIAAKRFKRNSGLEFVDIAREYVGGKAPGKLVQDVKDNLPHIAKLLRAEADTALLVHPVTPMYFGTDDVEKKIREATETILEVEGDSERLETMREAKSFIFSLLPLQEAATGIRILKENEVGIDLPWFFWLDVRRKQLDGKAIVIKHQVSLSKRQGLLPSDKIKELGRGIPTLLNA